MTLDRSLLRDSISGFFAASGMPTGGVSDAAHQWALAYVRYAKTAIAGGTSPVSLSPSPGQSTRFSDCLDSELRVMWNAAAWIGPSLTGKTLFVPSLSAALESTGKRLNMSRDPGLALSLITDVLHTYTLSITVTVTPPTGSPVIAPLT